VRRLERNKTCALCKHPIDQQVAALYSNAFSATNDTVSTDEE
jgi:hypothetical protein